MVIPRDHGTHPRGHGTHGHWCENASFFPWRPTAQKLFGSLGTDRGEAGAEGPAVPPVNQLGRGTSLTATVRAQVSPKQCI